MLNELALFMRFMLIGVYFYMVYLFRSSLKKYKESKFINWFFVGYSIFFFSLFVFQIGHSITELLNYIFPELGFLASIKSNLPGGPMPGLLFSNLNRPLFILGLILMELILAAQIYPLERAVNWNRTRGTKYLVVTACLLCSMFIPMLAWSFMSTIIFAMAIFGLLYGLIANIGINIKLVVKSVGEVRTRSIMIILGSLCFYLGFLWTLEIREISIVYHLFGYSYVKLDITLGCIAQVVAAILYRRGFQIKALVDYYNSQRYCIVHKGPIEGRVYMCSNCSIFYCMKCKEAIINAENTCWNCGDTLDKSLEIRIQLKTGDELFDEFVELRRELDQDTYLGTLGIMLKVMDKIIQLDTSGIAQVQVKELLKKDLDISVEDDDGDEVHPGKP
ncbi:MAG: hypothetical protein ACFFCS_06100 [Candidatus Hodarchaeota archaeon]